jgi:hypothetical protein
MFDSRKNRRADENFAARIPLALGVAHARSKALPFGAEARQSVINRADPGLTLGFV